MILVTGGAGFIGSHVVDALVADGQAVRVIDCVLPAAHRRRPDYLNPNAEVIEGDVTDPSAVARALRGVDAVCHQAAMVGLGQNMLDVADYVRHNDLGTAVLFASSRRRALRGGSCSPAAWSFTARAATAARGTARPAGPAGGRRSGRGAVRTALPGLWARARADRSRGVRPLDPRSVYAATKVQQEHLCFAFSRETGIPVSALRYHNVYGPRMPPDTPYAGVAAIFASALAAGRSPRVFEDGGQLRDFVHVRDVARANVIALTRDEPATGAFNVASGNPRSVGEMAAALAAAAGPGAPPPTITGEFRLGDVRHVFASAKLAERQTWLPRAGGLCGGNGGVRGRPAARRLTELRVRRRRAAAARAPRSRSPTRHRSSRSRLGELRGATRCLRARCRRGVLAATRERAVRGVGAAAVAGGPVGAAALRARRRHEVLPDAREGHDRAWLVFVQLEPRSAVRAAPVRLPPGRRQPEPADHPRAGAVLVRIRRWWSTCSCSPRSRSQARRCHLVLRRLWASRAPVAAVIAVLFSLLAYHFFRGESHLLLSAYLLGAADRLPVPAAPLRRADVLAARAAAPLVAGLGVAAVARDDRAVSGDRLGQPLLRGVRAGDDRRGDDHRACVATPSDRRRRAADRRPGGGDARGESGAEPRSTEPSTASIRLSSARRRRTSRATRRSR